MLSRPRHEVPGRNGGEEPPGLTTAKEPPPPRVVPIGTRIAQLAWECRERDVTLGELLARMEGHSLLLLIFLLSIPFCQPIPLTGLATVFGIPLTYLGWRMMSGKKLTLPARLRGIVVPKRFFPMLLTHTGRLMRWLERHLRGEWSELLEPRWVRQACGVNIFVSSFLLALPVLVPCSNFFPALPVALTAAALLERDGKMLIRALVATIANAAFWIFWAVLIYLYGGAAVSKVEAWVGSLWE